MRNYSRSGNYVFTYVHLAIERQLRCAAIDRSIAAFFLPPNRQRETETMGAIESISFSCKSLI